MTINEIIETFKELKSVSRKLSKASLNAHSEAHWIIPRGKFVIEAEGFIVRADTRPQTYQRLHIQSLSNCPRFFLPEEIIYQDYYVTVTKQKKLLPFEKTMLPTKNGQDYVRQKYIDKDLTLSALIFDDIGKEEYELLYQFCKKYEIFGMRQENLGIDEQKNIRCFDWMTPQWFPEKLVKGDKR